MPNVHALLSKLSVFDLKRLVVAKKLVTQRDAIVGHVERLKGRLGDATQLLSRLDRRIARLIRRASGSRAPARRGRGRGGRRGPRKGSLRSLLTAVLKQIKKSATARELANLALKAGYKTRSNFIVFLRAVNQALHVNKEFHRGTDGKYTLRG